MQAETRSRHTQQLPLPRPSWWPAATGIPAGRTPPPAADRRKLTTDRSPLRLPWKQPGMKVAIVHFWLLNQRGGEAVMEAFCRLLPGADIFTLFYDPARVSPELRAQRIHTSFLNPLRRWYRS